MTNPSVSNTGDGTRPTTSGGVDNIGGGEKFSSTQTAGGAPSAPKPTEHMPAKRTVETTRHDDSAAFGLHEDVTPVTNKEPDMVPKPRREP